MAVKINSGDLIHKVVFKQPTSSLNDEGGSERTYTEVMTLMCAKVLHNGVVVIEANTTALIKTTNFYARWMPATQLVTKKWILENEETEYLIDDIDRVTHFKEFIKFTVKARE